jgi:CHAT domain-containing protein
VRRGPILPILLLGSVLSTTACRSQSSGGADEGLDARLASAHEVQVKQGPKAAVALYDGIIATARQHHDRRHEALALGHLGIAYKNLGEYGRAMELQQQALAIKREVGDEIEIGKTLTNMGLIEEAKGNCGRALELYGESLEIFTRLKEPGFEASVLNNQGLCYDAVGDYRRSKPTFEKALALHRDAGNDAGESQSLGNLGGVALLLGRYADAAAQYEQSLAISTRLDAKQSMALDLINLGLARAGTGEFAVARDHLERAREIAHEAGLLHEEADAGRDLGNLLAQLGRYDDGRKALDAAIASYAQAGLAREKVDAGYSLGLMDLETGDLGHAASVLSAASADARRLKYHSGQLAADLALTELELRRHNPDAAASQAENARATAAAADDQATVASALTWLARARQAQGRGDLAVNAANAALDAATKTKGPALLADARIALGDSLLASKRPDEARVQYDAVLKNDAASAIPDLLWRASFGLGRSEEATGHLDAALTDYLRAVNTIEQVRSQLASETARTGFLDDKREAYIALVRLLLRMGRTKEAFQAAERLRTQAYRELVRRSVALGATEGAIPASLLARIRQLQAAIGKELERPLSEQRGEAMVVYREELRAAEESWSAAVTALTSRAPLARALRSDTDVSMTEVQRHLPLKSALVEFVVGHDETSVFVLTASQVKALTLPVGEAELRTRIELLRGLLARRDADGWQQVADRLDAELIDPLRRAGWLAAATRLYVVPHAELNYLPFATLRHQGPGGPRLLVDDVALVVLPAASALTESSSRPVAKGGLLALAPPRAHLRFAREEVESIAGLFPASPSIHVGEDATEARFKQEAGLYRVLHLATHGFFNRVDPLFSGIELEPGAGEDGQLQVFEILGLPLAANLVTLSACDTALGGGELSDLPAGEELIGLTRAFLSAGGRNVLATLWEIDDQATAPLMADFYRAARTRPFPEALAQVQRERAHRSDTDGHPWHWAAFTIAEGYRPGADDRITGP